MRYRVTWSIDIEVDEGVDTPLAAAEAAFNIQRDVDSVATFFEVENLDTGREHTVDLNFEAARAEITNVATKKVEYYPL